MKWLVEAECTHGATHVWSVPGGSLLRAPVSCECEDLIEEAKGPKPIVMSKFQLWRERRKMNRALNRREWPWD